MLERINRNTHERYNIQGKGQNQLNYRKKYQLYFLLKTKKIFMKQGSDPSHL